MKSMSVFRCVMALAAVLTPAVNVRGPALEGRQPTTREENR